MNHQKVDGITLTDNFTVSFFKKPTKCRKHFAIKLLFDSTVHIETKENDMVEILRSESRSFCDPLIEIVLAGKVTNTKTKNYWNILMFCLFFHLKPIQIHTWIVLLANNSNVENKTFRISPRVYCACFDCSEFDNNSDWPRKRRAIPLLNKMKSVCNAGFWMPLNSGGLNYLECVIGANLNISIRTRENY